MLDAESFCQQKPVITHTFWRFSSNMYFVWSFSLSYVFRMIFFCFVCISYHFVFRILFRILFRIQYETIRNDTKNIRNKVVSRILMLAMMDSERAARIRPHLDCLRVKFARGASRLAHHDDRPSDACHTDLLRRSAGGASSGRSGSAPRYGAEQVSGASPHPSPRGA